MSGPTAASSGTVRLGPRTVARLGLGTNRLTPGPAAEALLARARALGVEFFDTADVYQGGASETALGRSPVARDPGALVATKGGMVRGTDGRRVDASPEHLREAVRASRERLGRRSLELYQLHRVDPAVPIETSVTVLRELHEEGLIGSIGLSNVTIDELERARRIAPVVSVQNRYNLLERAEEPMLRYCEEQGLAFLPWTPFHRGELAGVAALAELAGRFRASLAQIALRWLLARSSSILAFPGTLSIAHLEENVGAASLPLSRSDLQALSEGLPPAPTASTSGRP